MERVRKKMIRLMVISVGIMMIGLLAVLFAIVYKISNPKKPESEAVTAVPSDPIELNLGLPGGAEIVSSSVQGDRLVLTVKSPGNGQQIIILDVNSGKIISRINLN